jgi:flagellar hook-length control protein FliK
VGYGISLDNTLLMNLLLTVENASVDCAAELTPKCTNTEGAQSNGIIFNNVLSDHLCCLQTNKADSDKEVKPEEKSVLTQEGSIVPAFQQIYELLSLSVHMLVGLGDNIKQSPDKLNIAHNGGPYIMDDSSANAGNFAVLKDSQSLMESTVPFMPGSGEQENQVRSVLDTALMTHSEKTENDSAKVPASETILNVFTDKGAFLLGEADIPHEPFSTIVKGSDFFAQNHHSSLKDIQTIKIYAPFYAIVGEEQTDKPPLVFNRVLSPQCITPTLVKEIHTISDSMAIRQLPADRLSLRVEDSAVGEKPIYKEQVHIPTPDKSTAGHENVFFSIENTNSQGTQIGQHIPEGNVIISDKQDYTAVEGKKGDASIEVSLEPDGLGKIDIELVLDRGVINGQINASETVGKEMIERNLDSILRVLINEGLQVGSFSVSLQNNRSALYDDGGKEDLQELRVVNALQLPSSVPRQYLISIFV